MSGSVKSIKLSRFGFNNKKKLGINYWRFYFNGIEVNSAVEQIFYIEIEMLNAWLSPKEPVLGYKPRVSISSEDLQYALAGTKSAQDIKTETILQPSYCVIRIGKLGKKSKQICNYYSSSLMKFYTKPFGIEVGENVFTDDRLCGQVSLSSETLIEHPEYLCECGNAKWNLTYEIQSTSDAGYSTDSMTWFPSGLSTKFSGNIEFDGIEYIVDPRRSYGYIDRYWGKVFPSTWFHISSSSLQSIISGSQLFNSSFAVHGNMDGKVSLIGNFENTEINFCAKKGNTKYSCIHECIQAPEQEDPLENMLHWTVSINNKVWIIDIDIFCKIRELYNRNLEIPEGNRKVLNILESATGSGEIKLYHRKGNDIEQIENATITKAICQFGHIDEAEKL